MVGVGAPRLSICLQLNLNATNIEEFRAVVDLPRFIESHYAKIFIVDLLSSIHHWYNLIRCIRETENPPRLTDLGWFVCSSDQRQNWAATRFRRQATDRLISGLGLALNEETE